MASYLATIDIGFWDVTRWADRRRPAGLRRGRLGDHRRRCARRSTRRWRARARSSTCSSDAFGPYPFSTVGAIVDNQDDLFFALETQTRPVYSKYFWLDSQGNAINGDGVVVHELAHQWFGDDVALARWQDIWLNEGFATYAEWLWAEHEGRATPQEIFQADLRRRIPADDPFWSVRDRRPGRRPPVRQRRLRPRRDDPAGAAQRGRRRRVLARSSAAGPPRKSGGNGTTDAVHRARRASVRASSSTSSSTPGCSPPASPLPRRCRARAGRQRL